MLTITGGVVFLPKDGPNGSHTFSNSLDANNVLYERLSAGEVNRRWPGFNVPDSVDTIYTADTGIVHASKAVTTIQYLARGAGAIHIYISAAGDVHAKKIIIAADAWTNKLLGPLGVELPITVMQEQVTYYKPKPEHEARFEADKFPVWIWGGAGSDEKWFYGLIPDHGEELRTVTCQYTITPDRQFIISPMEKHKDIIVALGNAYAFNFAPAIGRVTADLALEGKATDDLSKFGFSQPTVSKL
ncbi:unnamed protein product [Clonostachys rhizophaga]|uniref:FAD dependent oxidoreductase domain-containing protein n=1 Tax=Clonostachys rhizophaga TaxID=160324 RepID=A0A9N9YMA4_9HYPO|nr:unnamed protein product [Clonostachys rhizophaga]